MQPLLFWVAVRFYYLNNEEKAGAVPTFSLSAFPTRNLDQASVFLHRLPTNDLVMGFWRTIHYEAKSNQFF
jgi:hypothetical protein